MAFTPQTINNGDVITSAWGNFIQTQYTESVNYTDTELATANSTGTDIDTLTSNGSYFVSSPVNGPDGTGSIYVRVTRHATDTNFILQTAYSRGSNKNFTRRREQGTWTAWSDVFTTVNLPYATGTYTGNGVASRDITLPFTPSAVIVMPAEFNASDAVGLTSRNAGLAVTGGSVTNFVGGTTLLTVGTNKFTIATASQTYTYNRDTYLFNYIAFR